jgi:hypothetical protein
MSSKDDERKNLPSASAFRRYELCSGSWQLERKARELGQEAFTQTSEAAAKGERIHAWLAGQKSSELSESEAQTAHFLEERALEQVRRIFGAEQPKALYEKRLWLAVKDFNVSGRFDRLYYTGDTALVIDFKSGFSEPDPAEINAQLKVLAVLVALDLPSVTTVYVVIVSGPYGVSEAKYGVKELSSAYSDIVATLAKIYAADAPLTPGPEQCRYCPALNICQAVRNLASPIAKIQFSNLPTGGARAAKLLDEIAVVRKLCDQIEAFYSEKLSTDPDYDLPGYAMMPGNVRREVTDWAAAHARLGEYLEHDQLWGAANYRLSEIEKALGKTLKLKGLALKEKLSQILAGLIVERAGAASLKRIKSRPAEHVTHHESHVPSKPTTAMIVLPSNGH